MKKIRLLVCVLSLMLVGSGVSFADPSSDKLMECVQKKYTQKDRKVIVQWIFAVLSASPDVKPLTKVDAKQEQIFSKNMANFMMDLFFERCPTEFVKTMETDPDAIGLVGRWLGEKAMAELISDPNVSKSMANFGNYLDPKKFDALHGN